MPPAGGRLPDRGLTFRATDMAAQEALLTAILRDEREAARGEAGLPGGMTSGAPTSRLVGGDAEDGAGDIGTSGADEPAQG